MLSIFVQYNIVQYLYRTRNMSKQLWELSMFVNDGTEQCTGFMHSKFPSAVEVRAANY